MSISAAIMANAKEMYEILKQLVSERPWEEDQEEESIPARIRDARERAENIIREIEDEG